MFYNVNIGNPTFHHNRSNTRNNKSSTGKHLCSYFARKRRRHQRHVISGSTVSKNDNIEEDSHESKNGSSHPMETYDNDFYPIDDPSCQDNTWYDAISPYWTGGMVWGGAYVLANQVVSVNTDPIVISDLPPALELSATILTPEAPLLSIVDLVFTYSRTHFSSLTSIVMTRAPLVFAPLTRSLGSMSWDSCARISTYCLSPLKDTISIRKA
jgi:hypothetical protein